MCKIFNEVLHLVAEESELSPDLILSKSRIAEVVDARQLIVWFCFKRGLTHRAIAEHLGITRQAVCQKIQTIADKRMSRSFEFVYKRIEDRFGGVL